MQVAIGLPKFLLESENAVATLVVIFLFLIILIPAGFFYLYTSTNANSELQGIGASMPIYFQLLNEQILFVQIPKIISLTLLWEDVKIESQKDAETLDSLRKKHLGDYAPKIQVNKNGQVKIEKGFKVHTLMLLYLNGVKIPEMYKELMDQILRRCVNCMELMYTVAV